jgi:hypothetical protein
MIVPAMRRLEAIWLRIVGFLLILLGLVLFVSPQIRYTTREEIPNTPLKVTREKIIVLPRPAAAIIIAAGVTVFLLASRKPRQ